MLERFFLLHKYYGKDILNYKELGPSSGPFIVLTFDLGIEVVNGYNPRIVKRMTDETLFKKSSYSFIVILTYYDEPIKGLDSTKESVLFEMRSFARQKDEVRMVQQNVSEILDELIHKWII